MEMNDRTEMDIDPEYFHHIISCVKNIATVRPLHITQFDYAVLGGQFAPISTTKVIETMCKIFQKLVDIKPKNPHIVPVDRPGKPESLQPFGACFEIKGVIIATKTFLLQGFNGLTLLQWD